MTLDFAESWGAANKDYVVANRLFTYFLDIRIPEECHYYENIVKRYPAGTQIMGWTDELKADKLFADYGYVMIPFISVENMTVMSSFPSVQGTPIEPRAYEADPNTTYVAMLVADGDNLLHTMIYEPYTIEESEHFGEIPLTWVINPGIVDLAPRVFTWYDRVLKGAGQEMAAMMGDGSPNTDRYSGFSFYCALTRHYLDRAGILTMKQMIDGESVAWNVQPYCIEGRLCRHGLARHRAARVPHGPRDVPHRHDQLAARVPRPGAGPHARGRALLPLGDDRHGQRGCPDLRPGGEALPRIAQRRPPLRLRAHGRPGRDLSCLEGPSRDVAPIPDHTKKSSSEHTLRACSAGLLTV